MSSKNWFSGRFNLTAPPTHREPLGQADIWDGRSEPPVEDFAADARAQVSKPKQANR